MDTFEPEPEIDIAGVQQEIDRVEDQLKTIRKKMDGYLQELGLGPKKQPGRALLAFSD